MRALAAISALLALSFSAVPTVVSTGGPWGGITANQIRPVEEDLFTAPPWGSPARALPASSSAAAYAKRVRRWEAALTASRAALPVYVDATSSMQLLHQMVADLKNISSAVKQRVQSDQHKQQKGAQQEQQSTGHNNSSRVAQHPQAAAAAVTAAAAEAGQHASAPVPNGSGGQHLPKTAGASGTPVAGAGASLSSGSLVAAGVLPWQEASRAGLLLAVLSSSGLLPEELVPSDNSWQLEQLHTAAAAGSIEAQLALADRAFTGRGQAPDCRLGMQHLKAAASTLAARVEQEGRFQHPGHVSHLRERWMNQQVAAADAWEAAGGGDGPEVVEIEADAALTGDLRALRTMGYRLLVGRGVDANPAAALQDFATAARLGDPYAQFNLGYMHLKGIHVPQNVTQAIQYFRQAAARDLAAAHNGLGVLAFHGQGMERNLSAAREHFVAGAVQGSADSMYNLGGMYMEGLGVPRNVTEAMLWYDKSYAQGHWRAPYSLGLLYDPAAPLLYPSCAVAERLLWQFVAERSDWSGQLRVAQAQEGVKLGWPALFRYLMLAEQGCEVAQANAAFLLLRGRGAGGRQALQLAAQMLMRSSLLNATDSMVQLAALLRDHPWLQANTSQEQAAVQLSQLVAATGSVHSTRLLAGEESPESPNGLQQEQQPEARESSSPAASVAANETAAAAAAVMRAPPDRCMDNFHRDVPAPAYDPMYGGPTPYTKGYSFGLRQAVNSSGTASSSGYGVYHVTAAGSAPFPRPRYGHKAHAAPAAASSGSAADAHVDQDDDYYLFDDDDDEPELAVIKGKGQDSGHTASSRVAAASPAAAAAASARLLRPPGVPSDVLWLQQAADMGDSEAVLALAWRYVAGEGVPQDLTTARALLDWVLKAEPDVHRHVPLHLARVALRVLSMLHRLRGEAVMQAVLSTARVVQSALLGGERSTDQALQAPSGLQQLLEELSVGILASQLQKEMDQRGTAAHRATATPAPPHRQGAYREHGDSGAGSHENSRAAPVAAGGKVHGEDHLRGEQQQVRGWRVTSGPEDMVHNLQQLWELVWDGDEVDPDNLTLTILLGMLAGVLWLRQRQLQRLRHPHHYPQQRRRQTEDDEEVTPPVRGQQQGSSGGQPAQGAAAGSTAAAGTAASTGSHQVATDANSGSSSSSSSQHQHDSGCHHPPDILHSTGSDTGAGSSSNSSGGAGVDVDVCLPAAAACDSASSRAAVEAARQELQQLQQRLAAQQQQQQQQ